MASIRFGNGVSDVRGSINGTTFSRNGNGAYARNRTTPVNPRSSAQTAQRNRMNQVTTGWRDLTPGQRRSWIDGASAFPYTNRLGERATLTGPQLYNKLNLALISAATPMIDVLPAPVTLPVMGAVVVSAAQDGTDLDLSVSIATNPGADWKLQAFTSTAVSAGRTAASTPKTLLGSFAATTFPLDLGPSYKSKYGLPPVGANIVVELVLTSKISGQQFTIYTGAVTVGEM